MSTDDGGWQFPQIRRWTSSVKNWFFGNPELGVQIVQVVVALSVLIFYGRRLTWSAVVLAMIIAFFSQIRLLFESLTSLISRSALVEIKIAGQTVKLNFAQASHLLQKIADDIKMMIEGPEGLTEDQKLLFLFLATDPNAQGEIGNPPLEFERKKPPTYLHKDLRALRERHLVRPSEGGTWREHKSPELTPFGKLVLETSSFKGMNIDRALVNAYLERARQQ